MILERDGSVATICFTPPEGKPPTLDHGVLDDLEQAVQSLAQEPPRAVILRSNSQRFFCVGANLNALREIGPETIGPWVQRGHEVLNALEDLPCPVIARLEGFALGGGLELAMAADLIFAAENAQVGLTEAKLGFVPGWGGTRRLSERVGVARAKHLFFVGRILDAAQASDIGIIDHLAGADQLDADLAAYVEQIIPCSAVSIAGFKTICKEATEVARAENGRAEAAHSVACVNDPDTQQRLSDFFASRGKK